MENSLRWKTNLVTVASFIHELFCAHRMLSELFETDTNLDRLLDEALFRSYICVQGKNPFLTDFHVAYDHNSGFARKQVNFTRPK